MDGFSTQLPQAQQSFANKYNQLLPLFGSDVLGPLMQADANRVVRGAYPMPLNQTANLLRALQTGETQFPKETGGHGITGQALGFLDRFKGDVEQFVRSVPKLPAQLVKEVTQLPQAPEQIAAALSSKDPLDVFKAPGLRLLPGSYLASEGTHVLSEHPFFAAMDIAPYVGKFGKIAIPAAIEAAEAARPEAVASLRTSLELARARNPLGPVARDTARAAAQVRRSIAGQVDELQQMVGAGVDVSKAAEIWHDSLNTQIKAKLGEMGDTRANIEAKYADVAAYRASRSGGRTTPEQELNSIINKNYADWGGPDNPKGFLVPKQVAKVYSDYGKAMGASGPFKGAIQDVMRVYRTAILPLSPRWHLYNAIGGAILTGMRTGPSAIFDMGRAWQMARDPLAMPLEISRGTAMLPAKEIGGDIARDAQIQTLAGRSLGRIAESGAAAMGKRGVNWLWDKAEMMDNFYRSLSYLYGERKGLRRGMGAEEARDAGINLANKVLQDWDAQLPWERTVLKTVFPFYGWMHHILKYAATYPIDHPLRASITANLSRSEIEDWKTGLPQDFQNYFYFGHKDKQGNVKGINLRGANPFSDLGSMFTLGGFISQLNPIASGFLEAAGLNTMTGHPDLYPDVEYDPNTGRLVTRQPSAAGAALQTATGFIPQLTAFRWLTHLQTQKEREMQASNPEAYRQMVWSSLGVPTPRTINQPLEITKAQFRASNAMMTAWREGLKTGNFSEAEKYPQLRPYIAQVKQLEATGVLDQYRIQAAPPGVQRPEDILAAVTSGR